MNKRNQKTRHSQRKGILLLVVLSMLTLFLMIGTAYLVTANQYRRANINYARATEAAQTPAKQGQLLSEVLNQLLRDTSNPGSSIRYHSLLRDVYGNDGFTAQIDASRWAAAGGNPDITNGQMFEFDLYNIKDVFGNTINIATGLSAVDSAYNGLLVTFLDGKLKGQSTRVVGYRPPNTLRVMAVPQADGTPMSQIAALNNATTGIETSRILINGRPFNGTGVGYKPLATTTAALSTLERVTLSSGPADYEIALLPNTPFFDSNNVINPASGALGYPDYAHYTGQGGSDESYDAPDFQNMALAMLPLNPQETVLPDITATMDPSDLGSMVLPSFHRPALLNYWRQQLVSASTPLEDEPGLLRKVLLRPSWLDHPNFTGSNPDFANLSNTDKLRRMIFGPWDVDNDNDGIRDSVWIDFGAPVMQGPDGRRVKPLAALLVLDMDGRLNLNVHGTWDVAGFNAPPTPRKIASSTGNSWSNTLPHGQGYGPAEISLNSVIFNSAQQKTPSQFETLLRGTPSYPGRYGNDGFQIQPGQVNQFDLSAQLKMQGMPRWANGKLPDGKLGAYATPPDMLGRFAVGMNDFGQPVYESIPDDGNYTGELPIDRDNPYELDLSMGASRGNSATAADSPFSLAEMERILRAYDVDAGTLPPRIWELANRFTFAPATTVDTDELNEWRTLLTTDSYDMPVPNVVLPEWVKNGLDGPTGSTTDDFKNVMGREPVQATFADLLEYRLRVGLGATDPVFLDPTMFNPLPANDPKKKLLRREMSKLLSPDLADGLRLDINRAIGNGRDDNNNGVVDEPGEDEGAFWLVDAPISGNVDVSAFDGTGLNNYGVMRDDFDRDGIDGTDNGTGTDIEPWERGEIAGMGGAGIDTLEERVAIHNFRRQLLARHLYVMAMALVDPPPMGITAADRQKRARRLAQWAINIVDFRDPDNCMTAFEYDAEPFDGWGTVATPIDGLPNATYPAASETQLVWGSERPELVISETLAWHDLQIEDLANEVPDPQTDQAGDLASGDDLDLDQVAKPRGAFILELYNPWPSNPAANSDIHAKDANGNDRGVDLTAVAPDPATGATSPVWRIMVYEDFEDPSGVTKDPDDPVATERPTKEDRSVYFTHFDPQSINPVWDTDGEAYYQEGPRKLNVRPGRYMVVGSGRETNPGSNVYEASIVDPRQSPAERASNPLSSRRIEMDATASAPHRVRMVDEADATIQDAATVMRHAPAEGTMPEAYPGDPSSCITDVAIINMPRRLTLSEPAEGYPDNYPSAANPQLKWFPSTTPSMSQVLKDQYPDGFYGTSVSTPKPIDVPLDSSLRNAGAWSRQDGLSFNVPTPLPDYRRVYLQRLANPLLPWNKDTNPYRTVDSSSVNLTVISGREGPGSANAAPNTNTANKFFSNERGWKNNPTETIQLDQSFSTLANGTRKNTAHNIWGQEKAFNPDPNGTFDPANQLSGFPKDPAQPTLDRPKTQRIATNFNNFSIIQIPECTLGFLNRPFFQNNPTNPLVPDQPFPWLNWNNRPYMCATELMQVPTMRSSQLLSAFSLERDSSLPQIKREKEAYDGKTNSYPLDPNFETDGLFGHLPNFFRHKKANTGVSIVGLYRVLEYLHVPSRFVGTETWLNPKMFGDTTTSVDSPTDPRYLRQPPFNRISNYRDPGQVNLNTVTTRLVYEGLMHGVTSPQAPNQGEHPGPQWNGNATLTGITDSRRGYGSQADKKLLLDNSYPTFFANPLRSPGAGNLAPLGNMVRPGVECTMLRSDSLSNVPTQVPLFGAQTGEVYREANRNPYFRYQPMTRLDNLTTTRSNVYAVWVTIGFFEVEEAPDWNNNDPYPDGTPVQNIFPTKIVHEKAYPDGYMLGKEAGSDTGDIQRIREFAIIDRTIPVGFEPGKNHNVEKAIRLKRRID